MDVMKVCSLSFLFLLIGVTTLSCTDQFSYKTVSLIKNETDFGLHFNLYNDGVTNIADNLVVGAKSRLELYVDENDGSGSGFTYPLLIEGVKYDSMVIEFTADKTAIHNGHFIAGSNLNAINFNSSRNFFNKSNWELNSTKEARRRSERELVYAVTQQDYLNAN